MKVVKIIEAESGKGFAKGQGRGAGELVFNGRRISVLQVKKF